MLKHIELSDAIQIIAQQPAKPAAEQVELPAALGRILAEDCIAGLAIPPFDKSAFDGYAFRAENTPGRLRIVGTVAAGCRELPEVHFGEAVRIFTGAPIPPGADTVIRQEDTETDKKTVTIYRRIERGSSIIRAGEDLDAGELLISAGTRLSPAHLGVLASQGLDRVSVCRRPMALLIPTGTELANPGEERGRYGIYNSSTYALAACLERMGFAVERGSIEPDEPDTVLHATKRALENEASVVFVTGGASVGDYDFAAKSAEALGLECLFWKVNVKPGGALLVSRYQEKLLINLSGNPAAAMMSLLVVLRSWLEKLCGADCQAEELLLPVYADMPKCSTVTRLLRGHLHIKDGRAYFKEHQGRGNGNLASFAGCNCIGFIPAGSGPLHSGDVIRVLRFPPWLL